MMLNMLSDLSIISSLVLSSLGFLRFTEKIVLAITNSIHLFVVCFNIIHSLAFVFAILG